MKPRRVHRERGRRINRAVTREDPTPEKAFTAAVGRELEVSVQVPIRDSLLEGLYDVFCVSNLDYSLNLSSLPQPQPHRRHDPEQTVAANHEPKQLWVLVAAASHDRAGMIRQSERLNLVDDRLELQTAPV